MDAARADGDLSGTELMLAQAELWNHVFAYTRSMSLRCAVELGIPDAVHRLGGAATVPDLITKLGMPPSREPYLRRLMRLLAHAGFFAFNHDAASYALTPLSRLLMSAHDTGGHGLAPFALAMLHPTIVSPSASLAPWFRAGNDAAATAFEAVHGGRDLWAVAKGDRAFAAAFNEAMACDGRFVTDVLVRDHGERMFRGLASLVDVGGGSGGAARAVAAAFPGVRCSVLDLPHVVASVPPGERGGVEFVAGDMFEHVPKADAVLLKVNRAASATSSSLLTSLMRLVNLNNFVFLLRPCAVDLAWVGRRALRAASASVQGGDPGEGGRRQGDRDGPCGGVEPGGRQGHRDSAVMGRDDDGGGGEPRAGRARMEQDLRGRGLQRLQDCRATRDPIGDRGVPLISSLVFVPVVVS